MTPEETARAMLWLRPRVMLDGVPWYYGGLRVDDPTANNDSMTPEGRARGTIDDLLGGRLSPKTVGEVKKAADRAHGDVAVNRAFGRT